MKQILALILCVLLCGMLAACLDAANAYMDQPTGTITASPVQAQPVSDNCGNAQVTIYFDDAVSFSFDCENAVTLTDILTNLGYDPEMLCDCLPEYQVDIASDKGYGINLSDAYVRCTEGQAALTQEQVGTIQAIVQWAQESALHSHSPAQESQTVSDPISGYCGNTRTTIYFDGSTAFSFMYGNSVTLTNILVNLDYDPDKVCRCLPEYTVDTEFGTGYGVNLTEAYARCEKGQADLTQEQVRQIQSIIQWAKEQAQ